MELICVNPHDIPTLTAEWARLRPTIKRAYDKTGLGLFSATEVAVLTGKQLIWYIREGDEILAAAVTLLLNTDAGKVCEVVAGGREHGRWAQWAMHKLEEFAKAEGCSKMRIIGRRGWSKALPEFQTKYVIHEKGLA